MNAPCSLRPHFASCMLVALLSCLLSLGACGGERASTQSVPEEADDYTFAVSHILIKINEQRTYMQALVLARQVQRLLAEGQDFATLAKARSEDESKSDGGFLGFVPTSHDTSFAGAVQALSPGETSGIVRTTLGLHIIRRHTFEEGCRLERQLRVPAYGFWIPYGDIGGGSDRTRSQALDEAAEIVRRLRKGELTIQEAKAQTPGSLGPDRADAFLGGFPNRAGRESLFAALIDLPEEGFADPVDTEGGVAVLQRGRNMRNLVRHILVRHAAGDNEGRAVLRSPAEARQIAEQALQEAKADLQKWPQIVERYSEDEQTVANQGTWGVLSPGEIPLALELAVYHTPPGSLHPKVVESPLGFHVLYRVN